MKRPSVPQIYRNLRRWTEIASVLSKYGLAEWLSRFNIDFITDQLKPTDGTVQSELDFRSRIRLALTELGPTFIKFGQLLSTRPDLIGVELAKELTQLQSNAPADSFEDVKELIETEQGCVLEDIFFEFAETPLASASIGQVHLAKIRRSQLSEQCLDDPGGELIDVVVKVRHKDIDRIVETDLEILAGLAHLAARLDDFKNYQPVLIVRELSKAMRRELDFQREERNLIQFRALFQNDDSVVIPAPFSELCTSRMITMEFIEGQDLHSLKQQPTRSGLDRVKLAKSGAHLYLKMIFTHGFYHADPHPGNIFVTPNNQLALLDFGLVGRISEQLREDIESMLVAILNQDVSLLTTLTKRVGNCPMHLNESALSNELADFVGQYSTQMLSHFDMSGALNDFVGLVRNFDITLPAEASLLLKTLVTLEGTGRLLDSRFSLMEIMKPFHRMLLMKRLSPARHARKVRRFFMEVEQLIDVLPQRISNILEQVQTGRLDVHLVHRRLGPTVNRLVMGLMTSALFLGSALMLSFKANPVLFPAPGIWGVKDISALGFLGASISLMMGLRLMWAIRKSGNLDQPE